MLRGRARECEALDRLLERIRTGQSAVLVLRGEAGIGKTALLEHAAERASGCRVARAAGVQSEMELAYAGLHHLCAPLLGGLDALPAPQGDALRVAFGLTDGPPPDRFMVALAVLSLLAEAAEASPLVCLVDDAQWLDRASAQALAFVARRVLAERIALVFAVREPADADAEELTGLPELRVEGLVNGDARALLASVAPGRLDARVRERILAETRGNPLALLELPRGLTPAELAGGFALPDRPLASRIEHAFLERTRALPPDARMLLLAAAAEPVGDVDVLRRAAERLGLPADAGREAESAGLIELAFQVRFKHPLVRSAVYRAADAGERRLVHGALADATDPVADPDRRAWHHAHATPGPDEAVAAEMLRSAERAQRRGGLAAAAAFRARAAELTPEPATRAQRALEAAQAKLDVADLAAASTLLTAARLGPLDELHQARMQRLAAQIAFARGRGRDAPPLLLEAARRLDRVDPATARETYLETLASVMFAGRLGSGPDEREVAESARAAAGGRRSADAPDLLLDALVTRFTEGYAASVAPLSRALRAFVEQGDGAHAQRWLWLACRLAQDLWDDELWHVLATHGVRTARDTGALNQLAVMANYLAALHVHSGTFDDAAALIDEVDAIIEATGLPPLKYAAGLLTVARAERTQELFDFAWRSSNERGEGSAIGQFWWFSATLHNSRGHYGEALEAARRGCEYEDVLAYGWNLVELVEAGVRGGAPDEAAAALARLRERTQASGTEWALGIEARCRALVDDDESAYLEAIERLGRSRAAVELARGRLVYGEWLRRENRRTEAREQLRAAHDDFARIGMTAFAARALRERLATGEAVRRRSVETRDELTPQELQVARLARDGQTNPEIGAQLFISPRTVEYHLNKVFRKLDIGTRRDLRGALPEPAAAATAAGS